jgi:hypothetical protein
MFSVSFLLPNNFTELASATGEFATAVAELSVSELGEQLQQTLGALANVEQAAAEGQNVQSQQDMMTLMSTGISFIFKLTRSISHCRIADEYSRLINSVRVCLIHFGLGARFKPGCEAGFQLPCANVHELAKRRRRGPACTANTRTHPGTGAPSN